MVDRGRLDISKDLSFVDPRIRVQTSSDQIELLPPDYSPGYWDVICQGGKENYDHVGNRRFRVCIENNLATYEKANSKHQRSLVVTIIVDAIQDSNSSCDGVGFVRRNLDEGRWYEVNDKIAREKVGHALRDLIKSRQLEAKKQETEVVTVASLDPQPSSKRRRLSTQPKQQTVSSERSPTIPSSTSATATACCDAPKPEHAPSRSQVVSLERVKTSKKATRKRACPPPTLRVEGPMFLSGTISDSNSKSSLSSSDEDTAYASDSDASNNSDLPVDEEMESAFQAAMRSMDTVTENQPVAASSMPVTSVDNNKAYQDFMGSNGNASSDLKLSSCSASLAAPSSTTSAEDGNGLTFAEKAYQAFMNQPLLPIKETCAPKSKPMLSSSSFPSNDAETAYQSFMNSMAPKPIKEDNLLQHVPMMGSATPGTAMEWKPPGDKSAEEAFQAFMREAEAEEMAGSSSNSIDDMSIKGFAPPSGTSAGIPMMTAPPPGGDMLAKKKKRAFPSSSRRTKNNGSGVSFPPPTTFLNMASYGIDHNVARSGNFQEQQPHPILETNSNSLCGYGGAMIIP